MPTITLYLGTKTQEPQGQIELPSGCHLRSVWDTIEREYTQSEQMIILLLSTRNRYLIYLHPDSRHLSKNIKLSEPITRKIHDKEMTDIAYSSVVEICVLPITMLPQLENIENLQQQVLWTQYMYVNGDKKQRAQNMLYRKAVKNLMEKLMNNNIKWGTALDNVDDSDDDMATPLLRALSMEVNTRVPTEIDEIQEIMEEDFQLAVQLDQELNGEGNAGNAGHRAIKRLASGGIAVNALTGKMEY